MHEPTTTRRRFLVAAVALSGIAGGLRASQAWAQSEDTLDEKSRRTLIAAARRMFPHESISDAVYLEVLDAALAAAASGAALINPIAAAELALDAAVSERFLDAGIDEQINGLRAIEHTSFFQTIRSAVLTGIYNHAAVWALIGYGGPSWQQGGYLNRGAGEIDWLPEPD